MNKILLVFVCLLILNLVACSKPAPEETQSARDENVAAVEEPEAEVEVVPPSDSEGGYSLTDFRNSQFFQQHNCIEAGSWDLRNGNESNSYDVDIHMLDVEVQPESDNVVGIGLIFFERRTLNDADIEIIADLLDSLDGSSNHDGTMPLIRNNIETRISQIDEAESIDDGILRIWAGKVGTEQTISIELLE